MLARVLRFSGHVKFKRVKGNAQSFEGCWKTSKVATVCMSPLDGQIEHKTPQNRLSEWMKSKIRRVAPGNSSSWWLRCVTWHQIKSDNVDKLESITWSCFADQVELKLSKREPTASIDWNWSPSGLRVFKSLPKVLAGGSFPCPCWSLCEGFCSLFRFGCSFFFRFLTFPSFSLTRASLNWSIWLRIHSRWCEWVFCSFSAFPHSVRVPRINSLDNAEITSKLHKTIVARSKLLTFLRRFRFPYNFLTDCTTFHLLTCSVMSGWMLDGWCHFYVV